MRTRRGVYGRVGELPAAALRWTARGEPASRVPLSRDGENLLCTVTVGGVSVPGVTTKAINATCRTGRRIRLEHPERGFILVRDNAS
jgi:hypothetical protein